MEPLTGFPKELKRSGSVRFSAEARNGSPQIPQFIRGERAVVEVCVIN